MNVASGYFSLGRTACLRSPLLMEEGRAWAEMHRFDCLFDYRDFPGDLSHCEYPFLPHFYLNLPVLSSSWIFSYHVDSGELNAGPDRNGLFERSPLWLKAGLLTESRKRKTPNQPCPYQIPLFYKATAQNGVINNKLDWLNVICVLEFVEKEAQSVQRAQVYWIIQIWSESLQPLCQWPLYIQSSLLPETPLKLAVMGSNASRIPKAEKTVFRSKRLWILNLKLRW